MVRKSSKRGSRTTQYEEVEQTQSALASFCINFSNILSKESQTSIDNFKRNIGVYTKKRGESISENLPMHFPKSVKTKLIPDFLNNLVLQPPKAKALKPNSFMSFILKILDKLFGMHIGDVALANKPLYLDQESGRYRKNSM